MNHKKCWSQYTKIKQLSEDPSRLDKVSDALIAVAGFLALFFVGWAFIIIFLSW